MSANDGNDGNNGKQTTCPDPSGRPAKVPRTDNGAGTVPAWVHAPPCSVADLAVRPCMNIASDASLSAEGTEPQNPAWLRVVTVVKGATETDCEDSDIRRLS